MDSPPNALFEVYRPQHESYYKTRAVDFTLKGALADGDVWLWGASGVGKTACAMRAAALHGSKTLHIYLGSYQAASPKDLLSALALEVAERSDRQLATGSSVGETIRALADCILSAAIGNSLLILLIEEIPLSADAELAEFSDYVRQLREAVEVRGLDSLRVIVTSIVDPRNLPVLNVAKRKASTVFIHLPLWKDGDILGLISLICSGLNANVSSAQAQKLAESSNGQPRFIKAVFRAIKRDNAVEAPTMEAYIEQVRGEVV